MLTISLLSLAAMSSASGRQEFDGLPDLCGRWAIVEVMPALAQFPILGAVELTTVDTLLVDIVQQGACLELRGIYCFTDVEMRPPVVESRVPESFIRALSPALRTATLQATEGGWDFSQLSATEVRGATLADPEADPLPVTASDPRVFDQDGDGHPGLTVPVTIVGSIAGETYVVQRLRTALLGRVIDANTIRGSVVWTSEQNVLAASDEFLTLSYAYAPHPDSAHHVFVMRRVDREWTCQTVRDQWASLLGAAP
jgi:hypothetical protein